MGDTPRLTLYTRAGCHLCEEARAVLTRVAAATGERFAEVDIGADPALEAGYGDRIPVLELDGVEHGYFRVEERRLLRDLGAGA